MKVNTLGNKMKNKIYLKSAFFLFTVYLIFGYFVNQDIFRNLDYDIMVFFQNNISRFFDIPFSLFTIAGSSEVTLLVSGLIFLYFLFRKKQLFLGLGLYFLITVIELIGKFTIYHPKPPNIFFRYSLGFHLPSGYIIDTHFSYPSGHMARAAFVAVIFLFLILMNKKSFKRAISLTLAGLFVAGMFISRIYLGEHWITDVAGGFLLGSSIGLLALYFRN